MAKNQVGSFSICTIPYDQLDNYSTPAITKNKKTRQSKPIVYPLFEKCADLTNDKFWQTKLLAAANNKFPRGFTYTEGILNYRKGNKSYTITLAEEPQEALKQIIDFFHTHASIFSPTEENNTNILQPVVVSADEISWTKASKKMQELLLAHYVEQLRIRYDLTATETVDTLQRLSTAVNEKYFHKDNIIMTNNVIINIPGWIWESSSRKFIIDSQLKPLVKNTKIAKPVIIENNAEGLPNFRKMWLTYLKQLQPQCNFGSTTTREINTDLLTDD